MPRKQVLQFPDFSCSPEMNQRVNLSDNKCTICFAHINRINTWYTSPQNCGGTVGNQVQMLEIGKTKFIWWKTKTKQYLTLPCVIQTIFPEQELNKDYIALQENAPDHQFFMII